MTLHLRFGRILVITVLALIIAALTASAAANSAPTVAARGPLNLSVEERGLLAQALRNAPWPVANPEALDDEALAGEIDRLATYDLGLRVRPAEIDRLWTLQPPVRRPDLEFEAARRQGRLAQWLADLAPAQPSYRALAAERQRYGAIAARGGWRSMPPGTLLAQGETGPAVGALRERLAAEGYVLDAPADPNLFDAALTAALTTFQRRHGLAEDGQLGPATRQALDVSVDARLAQIDANLERWRWLPRSMPADRLELDIAGAEATLFAADEPVLSMRAIVGKPSLRTPMFASAVDSVVLNPPWNVPASIVRGELLPKAARDPGYLRRNGFVRTEGGWRQRPGPANALGQVKFDFPSPFGVYLHDTPSRQLFAQPVRTLSHGCMRLEKPRELAALLLQPQGWTRAAIDSAIGAGETRRISLTKPMPLFVVYRTAAVDAEGWAVFRPDPYGWDAKLLNALAAADRQGARPRAPAPLPAVGCDRSAG